MDRRSFIKAAGTTALASTGPWYLKSGLAQSGPIRIGLLAPLTGVVASGGREMVEAFNFFWDASGKKAGGRDIQVIVEDDASNPDTALQKARRLVEQANAHFLIGDLLANTGLAVAEYVKGNGTPYFIPIIAADDLTQRSRIPNVVRIAGYSASQMPRPLADYAVKKKKYRKFVTVSQDYAFGHEQCGGFAQLATELGATVVAQHWNPLSTQDFSPYLAQIQGAAPDAVFAMDTDQSVIRTLGAECEGIVSSAHFCEGDDTPVTRKFVNDYEKAFQKLPSLYGFSMYSGAMWLAEAINAVKGKVEDRAKFLDAVRGIELKNSPLGRPVRLDSYGNPIYDVYIREVKRRADGKFWNVPVEVYPKVSQFWTYQPEQYLKQPAYSRTYQGTKKG
jgi:branched-chain amino acid transport system substrate-binding protein